MLAAVHNHIDAVVADDIVENGHHGIVVGHMGRVGGHLHFKQIVTADIHLDVQTLAVDVFLLDGVIGRFKHQMGKTEYLACMGVGISETPLRVSDGNKV